MKKIALVVSALVVLIGIVLVSYNGGIGPLSSSILDDGRPEEYVRADMQSLAAQIAEKQMWLSALENSLATNPDAAESIQAEIDDLRGQITDLESQISDLQNVLDNRAAAILAQQVYLAEQEMKFQAQIAPIQANIVKYNAEKAGLESTIAAEQARLVQAEASVSGLQTAYNSALGNVAQLESQIVPIQAEVTKIDAQIAPLNADKAALEERITGHLTTKKSSEDEIALLTKTTIPGLNTIILALTKEIATLTKDITAVTNAINTAVKTTLPKITKDIAAKNTVLTQTRAKLAAEKTKKSQNESLIIAKNDELSALKSGPQSRSVTQKIAVANLAVKKAEAAILASTRLITTYEKTIITIQANIDTLAAQEATVKAKRDSDLSKKASLEAGKKAKDAEKVGKMLELKTANDRLKVLMSSLAPLAANMKKDQTALTALTTKIAGLVKLQEPHKKNLTTKNEQLESLKSARDTAKLAVDDVVGRIAGIKTSIEGVKTTLAGVEERLGTANEKLGDAYASRPVNDPGNTTGSTGTDGGTTGGEYMDSKVCCVCFYGDIQENQQGGGQCSLKKSCDIILNEQNDCDIKKKAHNSTDINTITASIERAEKVVELCGTNDLTKVREFVEDHSCPDMHDTCANDAQYILEEFQSEAGYQLEGIDISHLGCETFDDLSAAKQSAEILKQYLKTNKIGATVTIKGNQNPANLNLNSDIGKIIGGCSSGYKFIVCASGVKSEPDPCPNVGDVCLLKADGASDTIVCKNNTGQRKNMTCVRVDYLPPPTGVWN